MKIPLRQALLLCRKNAPDQLKKNVLGRIDSSLSLMGLRLRFVLSSLGLGVSLVAGFFTYQKILFSLNESGVIEYLKLVITDFDSLVIYWKEFVLAVLESIPVIEIVSFCAVLVFATQSLKYMSRYSQQFLNQRLFS